MELTIRMQVATHQHAEAIVKVLQGDGYTFDFQVTEGVD